MESSPQWEPVNWCKQSNVFSEAEVIGWNRRPHFPSRSALLRRLECRLNVPEAELQFVLKYTEADVCTADFLSLSLSFLFVCFFSSRLLRNICFFMQSHVSAFSFPACSCLVPFLLLPQQRASQPCIPIQNTLLHLCFPTFKSHQCYIIAHTHTARTHTLRLPAVAIMPKTSSSHNLFLSLFFAPFVQTFLELQEVIVSIFLSGP